MNKTRYIFLLLLSIICVQAHSQNISVKSFRMLDNDLTANTAGTTVLDQNGEKAALIKVVSTQTGFTFDCGSIGIVKTEQKPSEIWVYVPQGARRITISHPSLGILRDYEFPMPIERARTYEMVLTTGQVQTVVQQDAGGQYLIMRVTPPSAIVKIDDIEAMAEDGVISKFLPYGRHTYSASDPFYIEDQGVIDIGTERKEVNISLKPNYGRLALSTVPENGARVTIDGSSEIAGTTPFTTDKLAKGSHNFRFQLSQYSTKDTAIVVDGDGSTRDAAVTLSANFGNVRITAPDNSYIYINNENKGRSYWSGRLTEGMYFVEAKKDSYRTTSKNVNVVRGQNLDVSLDSPTPIYGMLNINSHPVGASVYVDGNMVGTTPNIFNNILIGTRSIRIKEKGYQDFACETTVYEGKVANIDAQLREEVKYVDMGNGVYWATCNVGADSPYDFGNLYAWGETKPKAKYTWENYKYGNGNRLYKYYWNDKKNKLDDEDDVARITNGEGWHIPTTYEWKDLEDECDWLWRTVNGVSGYMVTAKNGNSIFLPAAGYYYGSAGFVYKNIAGGYWTSDLNKEKRENAIDFKFEQGDQQFYEISRCCGLSIRPVMKKHEINSTSSNNNYNDENDSEEGYSGSEDNTEDEKVFTIAEQMPTFKGKVNVWLAQHLQYPAVAEENGIQGVVVVRFVVGKDGSISQATVVRGVDPSLDKEALRCVNSMPRWNPGYSNGQPAAVWFTLPIPFHLN